MTRQGYNTYILYLALQRHFSTDYDFFKYNGKVNASTEAYSKRQDIFSFEKLTKIFDKHEDFEEFFVAHFIEDPKCWIRNMSKMRLEEWRAHLRQMPQKFRSDMEYVKQHGPSHMLSTGNGIPLIHQKVIDGEISLESVVLLNCLYPFIEKHEKAVDIPFVWPDYIKKIKKYSPFVLRKLDYKYYEDIARDVLMS